MKAIVRESVHSELRRAGWPSADIDAATRVHPTSDPHCMQVLVFSASMSRQARHERMALMEVGVGERGGV